MLRMSCLTPQLPGKMSDSPQNQVRSFSLCLVFAGLALSLFLWGLGYKLSLYEPHQSNSHLIPRAKLFCEDERPSLRDSSQISPGAAAAINSFRVLLSSTLFFFLPFALTEHHTEMRIKEILRPWCRRVRTMLGAFLFRPPPPIFCVQTPIFDN